MKAEEFVGVCGFSSLDWVVAWMTDTYLGESRILAKGLMPKYRGAHVLQHLALLLAQRQNRTPLQEKVAGTVGRQSKPFRFLNCKGLSPLGFELWMVQRFRVSWLLGGAGATTVPLPTNISAEDIAKISVEAEIRAMVCSAAELRAIAPILASIPTLRTFVVMDLPRDLDAATQEALRKVFIGSPQTLL